MKLDVISLDGKKAGSIDLEDTIFGLDPRTDILQRMVRYQLAKRQAGTHKVKTRSEIARTGAKMFRQKGTGRAVTVRPAWCSFAAVAGRSVRSFAATPMTCPRRSVRWR